MHKVLDENSIVKYALCNECSPQHHNHEHVHFKCEICGNTICMDEIPIHNISLPKGFQPKETNLLIIGTCNKCNK